MPSEVMLPVLKEYTERRKTFRQWLLEQLVEGVHYGVPPGCEPDNRINPLQWVAKPSLYKSGADFICDLLQMDPTFAPDLDTWKMLGSKDGTVVICCRLISRGNSPFFPNRPKGEVLGEGRGAGVSGVKKRDGNGAVKIAQKSSKIDAVINTLGLSDLFTQDLEDQTAKSPAPESDQHAPRVAPRAQRQQEQRGNVPSVDELMAIYGEWKVSRFSLKQPTIAAFSEWVKTVLRADRDFTNRSNWTLDAIEACRDAMR
jgi:hypothetical protein